MDINFELYKIFYHAATSCSFSDAAKKLFISQSAVSQAIKNLEDKMGVQLFNRKTRSISLTHEGDVLYKHVEQAYNFIKAAENKIVEIQNLESGEIRLGVGDTICKYYLIPYLRQFNRQHPKVKIQVINRTSSQILNLLRDGFIDLGIVTLPVNDDSMTVIDFIELEDIFVASDKFLELKNRKLPLHELSRYPLLMLQQDSSTRRNTDAYLNKKGLTLIPEIELESVDLLVEFARIGLGIAHVLDKSAASAIEKQQLFEVQTDEKLPARRLAIVTMKGVPVSHAAGEFIKLLNSRGTV